MSVLEHHQVNRPSIHQHHHHHHAYYPQCSSTDAELWPPNSALICPISSHHHAIKPSYSSLTYSRSEQLRIRIHENHLSYLSRDETPFKVELRAKIETLITEYLSEMPHCQKFSFKEIEDCLSQSVKKTDFDPQKAISAFEAIERYATNLLNFPWRHEFQTIFAFSGHFYRVIECNLVGYRTIFELLGFAFDSSTSTYKLIDPVIDPDKVSKIALEQLVAIVECKIMLNIHELVRVEFPDISWKDIHSVRTDYVCNAETAAKLISDMKVTGRLIDLDLPDYSVKKFSKLDLLSPACGNKTIFDSSSSNSSIRAPPANYLESNLDSFEFIDGGSSLERLSDMSPLSSPSTSSFYPVNRRDMSAVSSATTHGSSLRNNVIAQPSAAPFESIRGGGSSSKVAPMNELPSHSPSIDSQSNNNNNSSTSSFHTHNYDDTVVDGSSKLAKDGKYSDIDPVLLAEINQFESNRMTVLPSNGKPKGAFPSERKPLSKVSISDNKANDRPDCGAGAGGYVQVVNYFPKNTKPDAGALVQDQEGDVASTAPATLTTHTRAPLKVKVTNLPGASSAVVRLSPSKENSLLPWFCKSCTYKNQTQRDICEMCHRSRKQGNESTPLQSGGRECSRCTLVNGKDDKFCKACGTSLADSPTYI